MNEQARREEYELYAFGEFRLDVAERILMQSHRHIHLAPKTYDVLLALVRCANHLVWKRELLDRVWPDVFVEEGIITVHVAYLRQALGDAKRSHRYIETVRRCGYRFVAPVQRAVPPHADQFMRSADFHSISEAHL